MSSHIPLSHFTDHINIIPHYATSCGVYGLHPFGKISKSLLMKKNREKHSGTSFFLFLLETQWNLISGIVYMHTTGVPTVGYGVCNISW